MTGNASLRVSPESIEDWIVERIAEMLNVDPSTVSPTANFDSFGIDSAKAISLGMDLEERLAAPEELPLELLFEADSIADAARRISAWVTSMSGDGPAFFGGKH